MSSTLSTLEVLQKARDLISDPKRWTQGAYARDILGSEVDPLGGEAVCYCSLGALAKASHEVPADSDGSRAAHLLWEATGGYNAVIYNDTHDHAAVLRAFDAAISKATAEGETA